MTTKTSKDYSKKYRETHKEKIKEYRETHKEQIKKQTKIYQDAHKEKTKEYNRVYYKNHRTQVNKYKREDYMRHKDRARNYNLKNKFGITLEEYKELFEKQCGKCAICQKDRSECYRDFDVDHNHTTGKVRGLLCAHCNRMIGFALENPQILSNALNYIKIYSEE